MSPTPAYSGVFRKADSSQIGRRFHPVLHQTYVTNMIIVDKNLKKEKTR